MFSLSSMPEIDCGQSSVVVFFLQSLGICSIVAVTAASDQDAYDGG